MIPIRYEFHGPKNECSKFIHLGNLRMSILERLLSFQDLETGSDTIEPFPGVEVRCDKIFKHRVISITVAKSAKTTSEDVKKRYIQESISWIIHTAASKVTYYQDYSAVTVTPVFMAVTPENDDYHSHEYNFRLDGTGAIGNSGISNLTQVRYTRLNGDIFSLLHYRDSEWGGDSATVFLVVEIVGELGMPSLRIAVDTEGTVKVQGAFSDDFTRFYYVHSLLPPAPGMFARLHTIVNRREYHLVTDGEGIKSWNMVSSDEIDYRSSGLYWDETDIDENGTVGTFCNDPDITSKNEAIYNPPPAGFINPGAGGSVTQEITIGSYQTISYFGFKTNLDLEQKQKQKSVVISGDEYTPILAGTGNIQSDNYSYSFCSGECTGCGFTDEYGNIIGTFSSISTDTFRLLQQGPSVYWDYGATDPILEFNGTHREEHGWSWAVQGCYEDATYSMALGVDMFDKRGYELFQNNEKFCIYTDFYKDTYTGNNASSSSGLGQWGWPAGGDISNWFAHPYFQGDVYDHDLRIGQDLLYPFAEQDVSQITSGFVSYDRELDLRFAGVRYCSDGETDPKWKIIVTLPGSTTPHDITTQVKDAYWGSLRIDIVAGEIVDRTDEQKRADFEAGFNAMYFRFSEKKLKPREVL